MRKSTWYLFSLILVFTMIFTACGNNNEASNQGSNNATNSENKTGNNSEEDTSSNEGNEEQPTNTPDTTTATLSLYDGLFTEAQYNETLLPVLQKQFPNLTIERVPPVNAGTDMQTALAAGTVYDVILNPVYAYQTMADLGITLDMSELIKKHNIDIEAINPAMHDHILLMGDDKYVSLPLYRNIVALFYNKSLFDQFGVEYPTDGMTYEEILEIATDLTRTDSGHEYFGFGPTSMNLQAGQVGETMATMIDPETNRSALNSSSWQKIFNYHKQIFDIPGMKFLTVPEQRNAFIKDQNMAMLLDWIPTVLNSETTADWDMVTMPYFEGQKEIHSLVDFHGGFLSSESKQKDAAAKLLGFMATSVEFQTALAQLGFIPAIEDEAALAKYGEGKFDDKNILSVIQNTVMAPQVKLSPYENLWNAAGALRGTAYNDAMSGATDVNTALRDAAEQSNKEIATQEGANAN